MIRIAACMLASLAGAWAQFAGIEGTWQGTLDAGPVKLRLGLHIAPNGAGGYSSTLDSIDQNAMGLPVRETAFSDHKLHLDMPKLHAQYDGVLSSDGREIRGTFTQGQEIPLTFRRVERIGELIRPQNPKPPYPYRSEEVAYESRGFHLAGTITLPSGSGPFAAALLITGSGPQDRDESLLGHKPFWVIADYLTRRGIAVLRMDDRGMGQSTGNSTMETLDDMTGDVLAGIAFLKARQDIDGRHIGVIGHSEGAVVGPAAAVKSSDIAFVAMLAGTGVPGEDVMRLQAALIARSGGATEEAIAANRAVQDLIFDALKTGKDRPAAIAQMRASWRKLKAGEAGDPKLDAAMEAEFSKATLPEMRSFFTYDPAQALRKLKTPVLALNGARDLQVSPGQNLPAIAAALASAGNGDFMLAELPGLNHLFQKCVTCVVEEYGQLEETFSPSALEILGDWVIRHAR